MRLPDGRPIYTDPCGIRKKWPSGRRNPLYIIETENTPATSTPRSHLTREVSFDRDFPEYPSTPNLKREKALVITSPDLDMIQEASEGSAYGLSRSNTGTTPKSDRIGIQIF